MKGKFDAYVLWPLAKRVQNWIVDQFTARDFTIIVSYFNYKYFQYLILMGNSWHNYIASFYSLTVLNIPLVEFKSKLCPDVQRVVPVTSWDTFFIMIPPYCVCSRLLHQSVVDKASWAAKWAKSSSVYIAVRPNWTLTMADFATFTQQICFCYSLKSIGSFKRSEKFRIGCWIRSVFKV